VAANGGTSVGIRKRRLNISSTGATLADNPAKRRTDLSIPDPAWTVRSETIILSGEWLPVSTAWAGVDLVRLEADLAGSIVTGLDSGASDPTKLVKFFANVGSNSIVLRPPASPIAGKQYIAGDPYTLAPNGTVRVVWDTVTRVYRVKGTSGAPPVTSLIMLGSSPLDLDGDHISNPL
jgi:hypothetical protein